MEDYVDVLQRGAHGLRIANVALHEFRRRIQVFRRAVGMNLTDQRIQHPHLTPAFDQRINQMRPDESGAARDEDV